VQATLAVHVEEAVGHVQQSIHLALVARLFGQFADDRVGRGFTEVEPAAREGPDVADAHGRCDMAEQDPPPFVAAEGVGRHADPVFLHGGRLHGRNPLAMAARAQNGGPYP
jgi:hypothetical protein